MAVAKKKKSKTSTPATERLRAVEIVTLPSGIIVDVWKLGEELIREKLNQENFFDESVKTEKHQPVTPAFRAQNFIKRVLTCFAMIESMFVSLPEERKILSNIVDLLIEDVIHFYGVQFANGQRKGEQKAQSLRGQGIGWNQNNSKHTSPHTTQEYRALRTDSKGRIR